MTKALVTGASGYIGGALATVLKDSGIEVRGLVRRSSDASALQKAGIPLAYADLSNVGDLQAAVENVDVVFHLAAITSTLDSRRFLEVNGVGTARLVQACANHAKPPTLIYVSSIAASGPIDRNTVRHESDRARPVSYYGRSKRAGEVAVLNACRRVPASIVRPGIVFGPGNREMLPAFRSIIKIGSHVTPCVTPPPLSYIHLDDLIEVLLASWHQGKRVDELTNESGKGVYFAVCPECPDWGEFGRMLREILNRPKASLLHLTMPSPWIMAWAGQLISWIRRKPVPLDVDKMREATASSWACSSQTMQDELAIEFRSSLAERLQQTADWYVKHGWL